MSEDKEDLLKKIYEEVVSSESSVYQSQLWKKLGIASKRGAKLVDELVKRGLISKRQAVYSGRRTYLLIAKDKGEEGLGMVKSIFCPKCPYDQVCNKDDPRYLISCKHLEEWVLEQYRKGKGRR